LNQLKDSEAVTGRTDVYNLLLDACGRLKRPGDAFNIYQKMIERNVQPDHLSYVCLLQVCLCSNPPQVEKAAQLISEMQAAGFAPIRFDRFFFPVSRSRWNKSMARIVVCRSLKSFANWTDCCFRELNKPQPRKQVTRFLMCE